MISRAFSRYRIYNFAFLIWLTAGLAYGQTSGGTVLRWTAPGDDGYVGTANSYQIRYQNFAQGPLNTEAEWLAAIPVLNVPFPSPAGSIDSVLVAGLTVGFGYYFALRTYDEAGNVSAISNSPAVVAVTVDCCSGQLGDVNGMDGDEPTISDVAMLIDHVFLTNRPVWCVAEADLNQSGGTNPTQGSGGDISVSDIVILIDYLFVTGRTLPQCY